MPVDQQKDDLTEGSVPHEPAPPEPATPPNPMEQIQAAVEVIVSQIRILEVIPMDELEAMTRVMSPSTKRAAAQKRATIGYLRAAKRFVFEAKGVSEQYNAEAGS